MKHKVLIVGVGSIGERHLRCFQATGRAELSLVEINPALRQSIAQRYGVSRAFADVNAALEDRPDIAVIATPADAHVAIATRLAEGGLHLLIEKPVSTSLDGIGPLEGTIRERGVIAAVGYVYRCHPLLAGLRQALAA